jgi:MSHA pilin protein MshC
MVELIVVMVLIGILGTIAVGRFMDRATFDTVAWAEQVRSTLRYAQKVAIAQNNPVFVHLTSERIAVCLDGDAACARLDARMPAPGGANSGSTPTRDACASDSWMCEARPAGVSMGLSGAPAGAIGAIGGVVFDGLGRAAMIDGFGGKLEIRGDGLTTVIGIDPGSGYVD